MIWLIFAIIAALLWSIVGIIDKHTVSDELKDPIFATAVTIIHFSIIIVAGMFFNPFSLPVVLIIPSIVAGFCAVIAVYFYYKSLSKEDVSRVIPIRSSNPILISLFAFIFLGETLSSISYVGILIVVLGAILISHKKKSSTITKGGIIFAFATMLFLSFRNILSKYVSDTLGFVFWFGIGAFIISFTIFILHHPKILKKKQKKGLKHFILSNVLASIALLLLLSALSMGPVSIVSSVVTLESMFIFIAAIILSKTHTHIIKEEMKGSTLIIKLVSTALILLGLYLIIL